jgi:hypothetical protein
MSTFKIISTRTNLPEQKTTVDIEIAEQIGSITRVKDRLTLSFDYAAIHGSDELNAAIEKMLTDAGFLA